MGKGSELSQLLFCLPTLQNIENDLGTNGRTRNQGCWHGGLCRDDIVETGLLFTRDQRIILGKAVQPCWLRTNVWGISKSPCLQSMPNYLRALMLL
jgi:hypothetical protein